MSGIGEAAMKTTVVYRPHTCLDGLALLALTTPDTFDMAEFLAAVERVHLECERCTPVRGQA